jgi:glycine/D-amino acid oxidase-like deaminating enzyme
MRWLPGLDGLGHDFADVATDEQDRRLDALPELKAARFARAWAGVLPMTSDSLPVIDRAPGFDDLVIAAGHVFGNGAGPTTGRLVADLICGTEPVIDMTPFRAIRPTLKPVEPGSTW